MLSSYKLHTSLLEIKEITRVELSLYDEKGRLITSTFETEEDFTQSVMQFAKSMAESQTINHEHYFKVMLDNRLEYVLLLKAIGEEAYMIGKLAVCQIRNLVLSYREQFDRNVFMQNVLLGNMLVVDMYNKAKRLKIEQVKRLVYVIDVEGKKGKIVLETLRNLFPCQERDFITEIEEQCLILIKDVREIEKEEEYSEIADMIIDGLQTEAMVSARVGYGNCVCHFQDISRSYQEAKMSLEVGSIFYMEQRKLSYGNLGIGRLIYQLPSSLCEMFLKETFGEKNPLVFDEETTITIQKFFENNLNISETARQLFLHRNTLVYRLDRIQKVIGLDIRVFEDAMLFKVAMMVMAHMKHQEQSLLLNGNHDFL